MKKAKFRISEKAVEDLEKIWQYTYETWSKDQANRYYNLLIDEINYISENPNSGRPMDYIKKGYRASIVKSHLIFYRLGDDEIVEVIRILHQMMDVESHLND